MYFEEITNYEIQYINFDNIIYSTDIGKEGKNKYIETEHEKMNFYIVAKEIK